MPTHESFLARKYFGSLDIFRFLAILAVLWHHTQPGVAWLPASSRGFLGVDLFFVISGFLIVTLLLRERDRAGFIALRQFYLRRSLRIFPIYYAMIAALAVFLGFLRPQSKMAGPFFDSLPYQLAYLSNFVGNAGILFFTWSLSTEEQFYLVWPPVEKWLKGLAIPLLLGLIFANQLLNFGLLDGVIGRASRGLNIVQITFTPICLGVLLAHVLHRAGGFARVARWLGHPWASPVTMVALILACNIPKADLAGWPRLLIQALMTLFLASCVIREDNGLNRLLGFRWVRRVGVISYGMYLYHEFAAHIAATVLGPWKSDPPIAFFFLTLALTVVIAELSYRLYEAPFLRLKDRISHGAARRDALDRAEERIAESGG